MKKKNILGLGLGLLIVTSPINPIDKTFTNVAMAQEVENTEDITFESFTKEIKDFKNSETYKNLDDEDKKSFNTLTKDLSEESFNQATYDSISGEILKYRLQAKDREYKDIYKEVKELYKENLSDEIKEEFGKFEEAYDSQEEYEIAINDLVVLKDRINSYDKELSSKKDLLKKGIEVNKAIDLSEEKKILEDENSNMVKLDGAIESINKKVEDFKVKQKEDEKKKLSEEFDKLIKNHENIKNDIVYKKSSKENKEKLEKAYDELKKGQKSLKDGKYGDYRKLIDKYNDLIYNLDGHKFKDELNKLIEYFNDNNNKIKEEKRSGFADELNNASKDDSFDSKKLAELDKKIRDAVKNSDKDTAGLTKVTDVSADKNSDDKSEENKPKAGSRRVQVSKSKDPVKKKSRSFVRTGVGSVAIVVGVLAIAAGGYLYLRKKK